MCGGPIYWCAFDWQSFSTLMTGGLAVLAAFVVGLKQTGIQHRQTKIQEAMLRSDLFDRRYKVFERAEQFIREILQSADDPSPEAQRDFIIAIGESRFLFEPRVKDGLDEIYGKWADFHALKASEQNPKNELIAQKWFYERFRSLPDLFDEMKLNQNVT